MYRRSIYSVISVLFSIVFFANLLSGKSNRIPGEVKRLTVDWDKVVIGVGARVECKITVILKDGANIPAVSVSSNSLDLELELRRENSPVSNIIKYRLILQNFEIDDFLFDGFVLKTTDKNKSLLFGKQFFRVSVPGIAWKKNPPIRDIKPLVEYQFKFPLIVLVVVAGLIILAVAGRFVYIKGTCKKVLRKSMDPWGDARKSLHSYTDLDLTGSNIKTLYFDISEELRECMQQLTGLPFLESTSARCRLLLKAVDWLSDELKGQLINILTETDPVKYAKYVPDKETVHLQLNQVLLWLDSGEKSWKAAQQNENGEQR